MISLSVLAEMLETKLNDGLSGYKFHIKADATEFERDIRENNTVTEVVNGLLRQTTSTATNTTNGIIIATVNCTLQVIFKLKDTEKDITPDISGYAAQIASIRNNMEKIFQSNEMYAATDSDNKKYAVSVVYDLVNSGHVAMNDIVGNSYTLETNIYYIFVENGINSRSMTFMFDGIILPYTTNNVIRTPSMDGNVYANTKDGATKNLASQSSFSITYQMPALYDGCTESIIDFIIDGELNLAHFLTVNIGEKKRSYLVGLTSGTAIGSTIENIGLNIGFGEVPDDYDLIAFNKHYHIYKNTKKIPAGTIISLGDNSQTFMFSEFSANNRFIETETGLFPAPDDVGYFIVTTKELKGIAGSSVLEYFTKVQ